MSGGMQATLRPYMERITELEEALRAKDAEIARLSAQPRISAEALAEIRKRIAHTMRQVVYSRNPYDRGYCDGITVAITAFDDAVAQWSQQPEATA